MLIIHDILKLIILNIFNKPATTNFLSKFQLCPCYFSPTQNLFNVVLMLDKRLSPFTVACTVRIYEMPSQLAICMGNLVTTLLACVK